MDEALFERLDQLGPESLPDGFAIAPGIVTLERDEKSGTYVITSLTEEGGRAA